ncbi:MAG: hypothetical protein ACXVCP_02480 [Bdellovibrio sp.]
MKLILFSILALANIANADVVKPSNTSDQASGGAIINKLNFHYTVSDQGWTTHANIFPEPMTVDAEKTFVLTYESIDSVEKGQKSSLDLYVKLDAEEKCHELAVIEFKDQTAHLNQKYQKSVKSDIFNSAFDTYYKATGIYFCRVTVSVVE